MTTVILYGPQGSGKTLTVEKIKDAFSCSGTVDEWREGASLTPNAIHITNAVPKTLPAGVIFLSVEVI